MKKLYRLLITLVILLVGLYFIYPSVQWYFFVPQADKDIAESSRNQIKVYAQEIADEAATKLASLASANPSAPVPTDYAYLIKKAGDRYVSAQLPVPSSWTVKDILAAYPARADLTADVEDYYRTKELGLKDLRNRTLQLGLDLRGGMYVVLQADFATLEQELGSKLTAAQRDERMAGALDALRNRIDQYGLSEPSIQKQGSDQIVIELPGTQDPERVQSFVMGKGLLTFHIVDDDATSKIQDYENQAQAVLFDAAGDPKDPGALAIVPKGDQLLGVYTKDAYGLDEYKTFTVLHSEIGLSGQEIRDAQVARDPVTGQPDVNFVLSAAGGDTFYKLTSANVGKRLAVVLDNKVKAAATIRGAIRESVQVTGFSDTEAQDLALLLRSGSLPVPLEIISQQAIGASLGQDAISQGIHASLLGLGLVFLFMLLYYRRSGFNAVICQLLHLYLIVSILSVFNFTVTLTSIAGLVLAIGMAVDANVLIFERMKEEARLGKSTAGIVQAGFSRAFSAIADSNITTIIASVVLSFLAKGSIQGFAMTLMVGNISALIAAVFVSRLLFDFEVEVLKVKRVVVGWRKLA